MEYSGLLGKYPVNRALTSSERAHRLDQKQRLSVEPAYQLSVIRLNATFMELVDKYFPWKGFLSVFCLVALVIFGLPIAGMVLTSATTPGRMSEDWPYLLVILGGGLGIISFLVRQLRKESFAYTHYPIRLNRKTRMVHVFRLNGTVLSVPWDEVFFCMAQLPRDNWEIQGHVLDKDGVTVKETFAFMFLTDTQKRDLLKNYWEFVRRYMEDGVEAVAQHVKICLPIKDQREPFWFGFHRAHAMVGFAPLLLQGAVMLFHLAYSPGRWFAMRTSKIPMWPARIEEECVIEPGDPYVREAGMNPRSVT